MALKFALKAAFAVSATAAAGYGGYQAAYHGHNYLSEKPATEFITNTSPASAAAYNERFSELQARQQEVENTTDEETSSERLNSDKRAFATDIILDWTLSERDLMPLAARFNALGQDDGIILTSYAASPNAIARRNECLAVTPPAANPRERNATAARVETCMVDMMQRTPERNILAAQMGGIGGTGMALAFMLGRASRRRRAAKPEAATTSIPAVK